MQGGYLAWSKKDNNMAIDVLTGVKTIKALVEIYKGAKSVSDIFLMKKINAFYEDGDFNEELVDALQKKSIQEWETIQDSIMHSLTHAETIDKARYTRFLVESLLENRVDYDTFMRFNFILQQLYSFDIPKIVEIKYNVEKNTNLCERLLTLGLVLKEALEYHEGTLSIVNKYQITELGNKFIEVFLSDLDCEYKKNPSKVILDILSKPKTKTTFF